MNCTRILQILMPLFFIGLDTSLQAQGQSWQLVWSDEFDYEGEPDPRKWNYDTSGNANGWGNREAQWYTHSEKK